MISRAHRSTNGPQKDELIHQDEAGHRTSHKTVPKVVESHLGDYDILPARENTLDSVGEPHTYSTLRWWYMEIGCCFLAVASLVAQAIVLWQYDGKPQDAWPSTILTLNGLIAILSTVCRATFMIAVGAILSQAKWNHFSGKKGGYHRLDDFTLIDDASRGSWGSLQLMWRFKGAHIACVGAVLTMLSLALGFFSQQLITLRIDQVISNTQGQAGTVARSQWASTVSGYSNSWDPLSPTKLAMYTGFMSTEVNLPQVTCPTGNCTWPIVTTVGVCGSCVDLLVYT